MNHFAEKACAAGWAGVILTIVLLMLFGCSMQQPCPAYVIDPQMGGTYDPNQAVCGVWYEWLGEYWWTTYDKREALDCWAGISSRQMYFEMDREFNFSVRAKDGYTYTFWSVITCQTWECEVPDTLYNITATRDKLRAPL